MTLTLHVVLHGTGPAFIRMPGCPCARCAEPIIPAKPKPQDLADLLAWARQAHTAASLVIERDGVATDHTLVDCGMGVVNNLAALPTPARNQPIHRVLLTHSHLDHMAGLDGLLHALSLGRRAKDFAQGEQPWPLPVFATTTTYRRAMALITDQPQGPGTVRHTDITAAARDLRPIALHPALRVTPIPVEHFHDSVNFLCEFWPSGTIGDGPAIRVALCWDMLAFPAGNTEDVWQGVALDPHAGRLHGLMRELDLLAIEMTNWRPAGGHIAFEGGAYKKSGAPTGYGVRDLLAWWQPKKTRIVHYSGWNDRQAPDGSWLGGGAVTRNANPANGPVSDRDLRRALHAVLGPEFAIDLAQPGQVISL
jgi:hypothetical protein